MSSSVFAYVTYIRATPENVWAALTEQDFVPRYWFGATMVSDWAKGSRWEMRHPDGRVSDAGEVIEADPPRRLTLSWTHQEHPELRAEGAARCAITLAPAGAATQLTVQHEMEKPGSLLIAAVADGWPKILANLKSLLESGEVVLTFKA